MAQFDFNTGRPIKTGPVDLGHRVQPTGPPDDTGSVRRALAEDAAAKSRQAAQVEAQLNKPPTTWWNQ